MSEYKPQTPPEGEFPRPVRAEVTSLHDGILLDRAGLTQAINLLSNNRGFGQYPLEIEDGEYTYYDDKLQVALLVPGSEQPHRDLFPGAIQELLDKGSWQEIKLLWVTRDPQQEMKGSITIEETDPDEYWLKVNGDGETTSVSEADAFEADFAESLEKERVLKSVSVDVHIPPDQDGEQVTINLNTVARNLTQAGLITHVYGEVYKQDGSSPTEGARDRSITGQYLANGLITKDGSLEYSFLDNPGNRHDLLVLELANVGKKTVIFPKGYGYLRTELRLRAGLTDTVQDPILRIGIDHVNPTTSRHHMLRHRAFKSEDRKRIQNLANDIKDAFNEI